MADMFVVYTAHSFLNSETKFAIVEQNYIISKLSWI